MSNQSNIENIDILLNEYNMSMDKLKNDFEKLNEKILNDYYNNNEEINTIYTNEIKKINLENEDMLNNIENKNIVFKKIMPLTEEKYKKDINNLKSNNKLIQSQYNNIIDIQELDKIKETNDNRSKHINDATKKLNIEDLKDQLKANEEDKLNEHDIIKETHTINLEKLEKELESDKKSIKKSNDLKKDKIVKDYSVKLIKIQNNYALFKSGLEDKIKYNKNIILENEKNKKTKIDKKIAEIKKENDFKYNKLLSDIIINIDKLKKENNNDLKLLAIDMIEDQEDIYDIKLQIKNIKNTINQTEILNIQLLKLKDEYKSDNNIKINKYNELKESLTNEYNKTLDTRVSILSDAYYKNINNKYMVKKQKIEEEVKTLELSNKEVYELVNSEINNITLNLKSSDLKKKNLENEILKLKKRNEELNVYSEKKLKEIKLQEENKVRIEADIFKKSFYEINNNKYNNAKIELLDDSNSKINLNNEKIKSFKKDIIGVKEYINKNELLIKDLNITLDKKSKNLKESSEELSNLKLKNKKQINSLDLNNIDKLVDNIVTAEFKKFIISKDKEIKTVEDENKEIKDKIINEINNFSNEKLSKRKDEISEKINNLNKELSDKIVEITKLEKTKETTSTNKIEKLKSEYKDDIDNINKQFSDISELEDEINFILEKKNQLHKENKNLLFLLQSNKLDNNGTMHTLTRINDISKLNGELEDKYKLKLTTKNLLISGEKEKKIKEVDTFYKNKEIEIIKDHVNMIKQCDDNIVEINKQFTIITNTLNVEQKNINIIKEDMRNGKVNLIKKLDTHNKKEINDVKNINDKYIDIKNNIVNKNKKNILDNETKKKQMLIKELTLKEENFLITHNQLINNIDDTSNKLNECKENNKNILKVKIKNEETINILKKSNKEIITEIKKSEEELLKILNENNKVSELVYIKHLQTELENINSLYNKDIITNKINSQNILLTELDKTIVNDINKKESLLNDMQNYSKSQDIRSKLIEIDNLEKEKNKSIEDNIFNNQLYNNIEKNLKPTYDKNLKAIEDEYSEIFTAIKDFDKNINNNIVNIEDNKKKKEKLEEKLLNSKIESTNDNKEDQDKINGEFKFKLNKFKEEEKEINKEKEKELILTIKKSVEEIEKNMVLDILKINVDEEMETINNNKDKNIKEVNEIYQNNLKLFESHKIEELKSVMDKNSKKINDTKINMSETLTDIENKFQTIENEINSKIQERNKNHETQIKLINKNCDSYINNMCAINNAEKEEFRKKIELDEENTILKLDIEYQKVKNDIFIDYDKEIQNLENYKENKVKTITNEYNKNIVEINNNFKSAKTNIFTNLDKSIQEKESELTNVL